MNKEQWFAHYEQLYNEREAGELDSELTDEDLAERAYQRQREEFAERADRLADERKEGLHDEGNS